MARQAIIYHNPRCTKSRQTLALLNEHDVQPQIIEYLNDPPDVNTLRGLLKKLGISAEELIRSKDFKQLGLPATSDTDALLAMMVEHPKIIERPIVVCGNKAVLGRPPENVLEIL